MSWPDEPFLNMRDIQTPKGLPSQGGRLLYFKSDGKLYTRNAAGVESVVAAGGDVTLNGVQALTNKDLSSGTNTFPSSLATDAELAAHAALTTTHGVAGALAGTTDVQTFTNKTLSTGTKVGSATTDISGAWTAYTPAAANFTVGTGTLTGRYVQIGKMVTVRINFQAGGTSSYTATNMTISLPVAAATSAQVLTGLMNGNVGGWGDIASGGSVVTPKFSVSTTNPLLVGVSTASGFTPGTTGTIVIEGTYEAA